MLCSSFLTTVVAPRREPGHPAAYICNQLVASALCCAASAAHCQSNTVVARAVSCCAASPVAVLVVLVKLKSSWLELTASTGTCCWLFHIHDRSHALLSLFAAAAVSVGRTAGSCRASALTPACCFATPDHARPARC